MLIVNKNQIENSVNECQQITDDILNHLDRNNQRINREELTLLMNSLSLKLNDITQSLINSESHDLDIPKMSKNGNKVVYVGSAAKRILEKKLDQIQKIINEEAY